MCFCKQNLQFRHKGKATVPRCPKVEHSRHVPTAYKAKARKTPASHLHPIPYPLN